MMKTCHKCGTPKDIGKFPKNKSKKDGRSETCLECKREYNRKHYANNKEYYVDKANDRRERVYQILLGLKAKAGCKYCPEKHPACLHFHHRDPEHKSFEICDAKFARGWELILSEIQKCDVVCANCHAKLHFKLDGREWIEDLPGECDGSTQSSEDC